MFLLFQKCQEPGSLHRFQLKKKMQTQVLNASVSFRSHGWFSFSWIFSHPSLRSQLFLLPGATQAATLLTAPIRNLGNTSHNAAMLDPEPSTARPSIPGHRAWQSILYPVADGRELESFNGPTEFHAEGNIPSFRLGKQRRDFWATS